MRGDYDAGNGNYGWGVTDADMYEDEGLMCEDDIEPEDRYDADLREEEREMMDQMAQFIMLTGLSGGVMLTNLDSVETFILGKNVSVIYNGVPTEAIPVQETPSQLKTKLDTIGAEYAALYSEWESVLKGANE